jgi:hypothetical protein
VQAIVRQLAIRTGIPEIKNFVCGPVLSAVPLVQKGKCLGRRPSQAKPRPRARAARAMAGRTYKRAAGEFADRAGGRLGSLLLDRTGTVEALPILKSSMFGRFWPVLVGPGSFRMPPARFTANFCVARTKLADRRGVAHRWEFADVRARGRARTLRNKLECTGFVRPPTCGRKTTQGCLKESQNFPNLAYPNGVAMEERKFAEICLYQNPSWKRQDGSPSETPWYAILGSGADPGGPC